MSDVDLFKVSAIKDLHYVQQCGICFQGAEVSYMLSYFGVKTIVNTHVNSF